MRRFTAIVRLVLASTAGSILCASIFAGVFAGVCAGCGEKSHTGFQPTDDYVAYEGTPDQSVVLTGESSYVGPSGELSSNEEFSVDGEAIITADAKFCSDPGAKMDVIVVNGEVVDVICYPPPTEENMTRVEAGTQGGTEVPQNANNTVVVFDPATDNQVIEGNIEVDGNNVAIYGNGADRTVIEGDLVISGNNARVRGLRIKGNVKLTLNNTALLYCVVEGNVEILHNNVTLAATDVFGDLRVEGNNAILVQNRVQGAWEIGGSGHYCDGNLSFGDADDDGVVAEAELGDPLPCE